MAAILIASLKAPSLQAPSPKKHRLTWSVAKTVMLRAAPVAKGMPPPTIADSLMTPTVESAKCIDPPRPLQMPVTLPSISAISGLKAAPLPIGWPWLL